MTSKYVISVIYKVNKNAKLKAKSKRNGERFMVDYKSENEMLPVVQSSNNPREAELKNKRTKRKNRDKEYEGLPSILKERSKETKEKEVAQQKTSPILPVIDLRLRFHASCEVGVINYDDSTTEKLPKISQKCPNYLQIEVDGKNGEKMECKMDNNYAMQRELTFERHSQNITRAKYSYFEPTPSPQPTSKQRLKQKELHKKHEEKVRKKYEKTMDNCSSCLEAQGDYKNMKDKLHDIQRDFVKRHKIKSRSSANSCSL